GTNAKVIVDEAVRLLTDNGSYERMALVHNPYGDGRASERILAATRSFFEQYSSKKLSEKA
ncbi:MAG TPA: hypothetical protein VE621_02315, partial [Bryobacteraceae bacterium]|nr:hypothetical protein [Bryobacteraceae bacterium]